jgi:SAM-dependent methyltransferase
VQDPDGALSAIEPNRHVGPEARKTYRQKCETGYITRFLSGPHVLDIGYQGWDDGSVPIVPQAIGIGLDYPGYDGVHLPFSDGTQDAVFCSHCLEHIDDYRAALGEWYRVLKIGGHLLLTVPHQWLYERKPTPVSRHGGSEHRRFYTPASLAAEIEESLPVGGYRIRVLRDNDEGFDYSAPPEQHAAGCYEIELVLQKIALPVYADRLVLSAKAKAIIDAYLCLVRSLLANEDRVGALGQDALASFGRAFPIPPYAIMSTVLRDVPKAELDPLLRPMIDPTVVDREWYLAISPDLRKRALAGEAVDCGEHYRQAGYFEWRTPRRDDPVYG